MSDKIISQEALSEMSLEQIAFEYAQFTRDRDHDKSVAYLMYEEMNQRSSGTGITELILNGRAALKLLGGL